MKCSIELTMVTRSYESYKSYVSYESAGGRAYLSHLHSRLRGRSWRLRETRVASVRPQSPRFWGSQTQIWNLATL